MIKDWDGVGKNESRTLLEKVDDPFSFRTVISKVGDTTTMLRTKGGMPQVTMKTEAKAPLTVPCVKSPLKEIAFGYSVAIDEPSGTGPFGYRRWYGEADPVGGVSTAAPVYEWSSDGLLCIETRKIQKICFLDAANQTVDFLFSEKPLNTMAKGIDLPQVDAAAAGANGRYRFTEGKYAYREWYGHEPIKFGWALTTPVDEIAFFSRRLKSTYFYVTDAQSKLKAEADVTASIDNPDDPGVLPGVKIKWVFTAPYVPDRSGNGDLFGACVNQNAREESFLNRQFFEPASDGAHMKQLTMRAGLIDNASAPRSNLRLEFKTPGTFTSAINPELSSGTTRPSDVAQGIDLCELSAFGSQYHGLVVRSGNTVTFYRDTSRTTTWPVGRFSGSIYGSPFLGSKYYNVYGIDSLDERYVTRSSDPEDGEIYCDAIFSAGDYSGIGNSTALPTSILLEEFLYKDSAGTVWVISASPKSTCEINIVLKRRYGVIGSAFGWNSGNQINRVLCTFSTKDFSSNVAVEVRPDAKGAACKFYNAFVRMLQAVAVDLDGVGALSASDGVAIGDGITATWTTIFETTQNPSPDFVADSLTVRGTTPVMGFNVSSHPISITCPGPSGSATYNTTDSTTITPGDLDGQHWSNTTTINTTQLVLDCIWQNKWVLVKAQYKHTTLYDTDSSALSSVTVEYNVSCDPTFTLPFIREAQPITETASFVRTATWVDTHEHSVVYGDSVVASISVTKKRVAKYYSYSHHGIVTEQPDTVVDTYSSTPAGIPSDLVPVQVGYLTTVPMIYNSQIGGLKAGWYPALSKAIKLFYPNRKVLSTTAVYAGEAQATGNGFVVHDGVVITAPHDDLSDTAYPLEMKVGTSGVGYAYNPRSKELITFPFNESCFFV